MNDKHDRRSQTDTTLLSAYILVECATKGYSAITVSDFIERANMGSSAFYSHYRDKDDLFVHELDRVIEVLSLRIQISLKCLFPAWGFPHVGEDRLYKALI